MPYHVGQKGSYGCEGYPALKEDGTVMGCHKTAEEAANQIYAINVSEGNVDKAAPCWDGYVQRGMKDKNGKKVPNCVPVSKDALGCCPDMEKADFTEGDYALGVSDEEVYVGQVVHVMREGMLGVPGSEMTIEATSDDPAILIRIFEQDEEGYWEETDLFVGLKANMSMKIDSLMTEEEFYGSEMSKAEGYSPPAGARAAARRAIKFKEEGKAKGAGTAVGWTRAGQLARGETLSLSTVKRMYSYFSRHEVDKKGKDWGSQANPSNGYIMWLAWGGDAGFSWSRGIVNRMKDKSLFSDFGKDHTKATGMPELFKSFGYPSANNPLPAKHSGPDTAPSGVTNHPKSTQESL